jgi:DNA-binding response OmpR family regulator
MNNVHLSIIGSNSFTLLLNELDLNYKISLDSDTENNADQLLVRIIFAEVLQLVKLKKLSHDNVPTIFLFNNKNFFIKNKLKLLDFHVSLTLPVEILSLREIINILLTKYNFFKKSKIIINGYQIDSNQRVIIKGDVKLKLTEKELELILTLNKNNGLKKNFLLKKIWNHNSDLESHAFETHLHRLRKKIDKFFNDRKFIIEKNSLYYLSNINC